MSHCNFRVRVKDGLELVLPGLQQNLTRWELGLENGYQMGNSELEFFGKHFGYGHDFTVEKHDGNSQLEERRKAQLKALVLNGVALRHVHRKVMEWSGRQGFEIILGYRENW